MTLLKYICWIIAAIGLVLFAYSFKLDVYTDSDAYYQAYINIDHIQLGSDAASLMFYENRETYLTNKFTFFDYGLSLLILSLFIGFIAKKGWGEISAPNANWKITLLGLSAAVLTTLSFVGLLYAEVYREDVPSWADSIGLPLSVVPALLVVSIIWAVLNLLGLRGAFIAGAKFNDITLRQINWWYGFLILVTTPLILLCLYEGDFWLLASGLLWLYFYLSILAGRQQANL